jgi:hypothetical protein
MRPNRASLRVGRVRGQLAPAVAREHAIDCRQRHRLAQAFLDVLLERRNDDDPTAHRARKDFVENLRFALQCRMGAVAQRSLGPRRRPFAPRHLAIAHTQRARRSDRPMAVAVCSSDRPSSSGRTTACAVLNSSAVFAVRNNPRAAAS